MMFRPPKQTIQHQGYHSVWSPGFSRQASLNASDSQHFESSRVNPVSSAKAGTPYACCAAILLAGALVSPANAQFALPEAVSARSLSGQFVIHAPAAASAPGLNLD